MDDREDGELSSGSDLDEVYKPIERPDTHYEYRQPAHQETYSESDTESDSDSPLPKRKRISLKHVVPVTQNGVAQRRPKNNIWSNVLQEESLMQTIDEVGIKTKRKNDRNVESYEYPRRQHSRQDVSSESDQDQPTNRQWKNIKRRKKSGRTTSPIRLDGMITDPIRCLEDVQPDAGSTDEQIANAIAIALYERKPELIVRVVKVLGQSKALDIYKETQKVEREGGILVHNGSRRRTSGGVFLQILKTFDDVTGDQISNIFADDTKEGLIKKRKRNHDKKRHKTQNDNENETGEENILYLRGLFSDDPGGTKCPGSTPVTSPQGSDSDATNTVKVSPVPLQEACEKAAIEIDKRDMLISFHANSDEMDVV